MIAWVGAGDHKLKPSRSACHPLDQQGHKHLLLVKGPVWKPQDCFVWGLSLEEYTSALGLWKWIGKENAIVEKCVSIIPGGPGIHNKSDFITNMHNTEQMLSLVPDDVMWLLSKVLLCKCCVINSGEGGPVVPQEQEPPGWRRWLNGFCLWAGWHRTGFPQAGSSWEWEECGCRAGR